MTIQEPRTPLRVKTPVDLIAAVPVILGFHPTESLVLLTWAGGVSSFHARVDARVGYLWAAVDALTGPCVKHGTDRVVILHFSDSTPVLPEKELDHAATRFEELGISVVDVIHVSCGSYAILGGEDRHDLPDMAINPITLTGLVDGRVVAADRDTLRERVNAAPGAFLPDFTDLVEPRTAATWCWEAAEAMYELTDADAARFVTLLGDVRARDAAWLTLQGNTRLVTGPRLDWWLSLCRRVSDGPQALPLLALTAFAAWKSGDGATSWMALDRGTSRCGGADYTLLELVAALLDQAISPRDDTLGGQTLQQHLTDVGL